MRADAQRNRERLIEVAREVFREQGYDASLDEVAKRAGVGAGTLYRHFPSREVLLDAIMQSWVDRVNDAADKVLDPRGLAARPAAGVVRVVRRADQPPQGRPGQDHQAMGDESSPIVTKCQTLTAATAAGRRAARGRARAARARRGRADVPAGRRGRHGGRQRRPRPGRRTSRCSRSSPTACSSDPRPPSPATGGAPGAHGESGSQWPGAPGRPVGPSRLGQDEVWPAPSPPCPAFGCSARSRSSSTASGSRRRVVGPRCSRCSRRTPGPPSRRPPGRRAVARCEPKDPANAIQILVSRLRARLGPTWSRPGRAATGSPCLATELDAVAFEKLVQESAQGRPPSGPRSCWAGPSGCGAGPAFAPYDDLPGVREAAARLTELRLSARERRGHVLVELGRYDDAVADLEALVLTDPLREVAVVELVTALARTGRAAEALGRLADLRAQLRESGLDPSASDRGAPAAGARRRPRASGRRCPGGRAAGAGVPTVRPCPGRAGDLRRGGLRADARVRAGLGVSPRRRHHRARPAWSRAGDPRPGPAGRHLRPLRHRPVTRDGRLVRPRDQRRRADRRSSTRSAASRWSSSGRAPPARSRSRPPPATRASTAWSCSVAMPTDPASSATRASARPC